MFDQELVSLGLYPFLDVISGLAPELEGECDVAAGTAQWRQRVLLVTMPKRRSVGGVRVMSSPSQSSRPSSGL